jgi:selenocysteine lyase/cysteine desulfurase
MNREGSDDFAGLVRGAERYRPGAMRYDVGESSNFALMPMLVAGLEQVLEWTPAAIQAYTRELTAPLVAAARERGFTVAEDAWRAGHLFGLRLPGGSDPETLRRRLADAHVWVSVRGNAVRVSAHLFNDESDVEALRAALLAGPA